MWRVIVVFFVAGMTVIAVSLFTGDEAWSQCNVVPGDADSSGTINLADLVYIIGHVFDKDRPPCLGSYGPGTCWEPDPYCRMDVNAVAPISAADIVYLARYLFDKDRPATFCLGSSPGNCWTPIPSSTCCLPVSLSTSYPTGQDPGLADEISLTTDGPMAVPLGGGDVTVKVWLNTDNTDPGNEIVAFSIPVKIKSSNPASEVYLADTTATFVYGGTAIEYWDGDKLVNSDSNVICLGGFNLGFGPYPGLTSGLHLIANLKVHATDSTTLSFAFWPYPDNPYLAVVTNLGQEYSPCAYKAGDLDQDGKVNIVDVVYLVNVVHKSWANPGLPCLVDVNGSTGFSLADVIYLANHVFKFGPAPKSGGGCCQ
jgi:hypothetical protein